MRLIRQYTVGRKKTEMVDVAGKYGLGFRTIRKDAYLRIVEKERLEKQERLQKQNNWQIKEANKVLSKTPLKKREFGTNYLLRGASKYVLWLDQNRTALEIFIFPSLGIFKITRLVSSQWLEEDIKQKIKKELGKKDVGSYLTAAQFWKLKRRLKLKSYAD